MSFSPLIDRLVDALRVLPGVGPKSAQRMALYLLEREREGGANIVNALQKALDEVGHCENCRTLSESTQCEICASPSRVDDQICVVEMPVDVLAIESAGGYRGKYFVLLGHLSPIDGMGPTEIGVEQLLQQVKLRKVKEAILATNPTVEGEATAHYLAEQLKPLGVKATRIAHGVPLGGELEYVDGGTLTHAFAGRREL